MTTFKNVLNQIDSKIIEAYKITEAFISEGELYMTSDWPLSFELYNTIEEQILNNN